MPCIPGIRYLGKGYDIFTGQFKLSTKEYSFSNYVFEEKYELPLDA